MRILKRNLAFVLALVMALSLTVSAANVKDYKDANDITFVEAVDTLTALGILEGEDGVFNPTNTLTREQGAKIIAYLMLGQKAADNLTTATAPFNDVAANRWSAGYVRYCADKGSIGGYGNGNQHTGTGNHDNGVPRYTGNDFLLRSQVKEQCCHCKTDGNQTNIDLAADSGDHRISRNHHL